MGRDAEGEPLKVRVLGRDAQDTQRLARRWRSLAYRDPPRSVAVGRLEQVEHEALATLMAAQAGVRVPEVVTAALGPDGDALIVTRQPDVEPLETLQPRPGDRRHARGACGGRSPGSTRRASRTAGSTRATCSSSTTGPMLVDLSAATLGAPQSALDIDVAELLVACTVLVGPERACARPSTPAGPTPSVACCPTCSALRSPRISATSHASTRSGSRICAQPAAAATGQEAPEVAPLRRFRPKDLVLTAALVFAAYLLITQLADIGFGTIAHELAQADVAWVVLALILAQSTFIASGISVRGAVPTPLALLPCVVLQSAIKFINLTVPSSAGRIGINLRFLQRMGAPTPAGGRRRSGRRRLGDDRPGRALPDHASLRPRHARTGDSRRGSRQSPRRGDRSSRSSSAWSRLAVPALRAKVVPADHERALQSLGGRPRPAQTARALRRQRRLRAALRARARARPASPTASTSTSPSSSSSTPRPRCSRLIPAPGGIGAAEASLTAGLIALGVDESTAFTIAFTQRLCTYYLPPIWGYASLRWLNRKGYL